MFFFLFSLEPEFYFWNKTKITLFWYIKNHYFLNLFYQKLLLRTIGSNNLFLDLSGQAIFYVRDADRIRKKPYTHPPPPP